MIIVVIHNIALTDIGTCREADSAQRFEMCRGTRAL